MSAPITLGEIYRFPLKSGMAEVLTEAQIEPRGIQHDRRWMLCDADGVFITGRQLGNLVRWMARCDGQGLVLQHPSGELLHVPMPPASAQRIRVRIWSDHVQALPSPDPVNQVVSRWLGRTAILVYMDNAASRRVDAVHGEPSDEVSFADGYPFLIISQAALDGLNARLVQPLPMLRFRPNFVLHGALAHAEDLWRRISIGALSFDLVKPCTRCVFTTVQPEDGARDPLGEPLNTLKSYRRSPNGIIFGMNAIARGFGTLRTGDEVTVLS